MLPNLVPSYSGVVEILDVSNILYVQTSVQSKIKFSPNIVKGVNIAGVAYIINKIAHNYSINVRTVLALDSFTDRKNISSEYKSNRVFHPEIAVQSDIINSYFRDFGVDVFRIKGMEADDVIYSVVLTNREDFSKINVYTGDRDIYGCVYNKDITIVGTSSTRPTIGMHNYETVCYSKETIKYNTVLPYTMIFGKPANSVKGLKVSINNRIIYEKFLSWLTTKEYSPADYSREEVFVEFCTESYSGNIEGLVFTEDDITTILDRLPLVYPKIKSIEIKREAPQIDVEKLLQFLSFYQQYTACEKFGLNNFIHTVEVPTAMNTKIKQIYGTLKNGTLAADNNLAANTLPIAVSSTNEFAELESW